jgi:membrane protein DedA with SNARE-associated domain
LASTRPTRATRDRRTLTLLVIPIVGFMVLSAVGDAIAPTLVDTHPLLLLSMNARNRTLLLVTNQLDAWSYYTVGTLRLVASDPLFFLVGYWYGDMALSWMEKRTKTFGQTLRQWEGWFGKAAYPIVFFAPNQYICLFAGAAGMSVAGFFVVNIAGTITRLYLIRRLGEAFDAPIDDVLGFIADYRLPLLIVSVGLAAVFLTLELRKGTEEVEAILEDLEEAEETEVAEADEERT